MKHFIFSLLKFIFNSIDRLISSKNYTVFATRSGNDYADNSRILFEYFLEKGDENVFFFTKKKSILKKIPKNGVYTFSFKGFRILLKSRIVIFTHGSADFFPFAPPKHMNRTFINLFHAIAVKKVGIQSDKRAYKESLKWNYFLVSSPFEGQFIKEQYKLNSNQILNFGQPRNDILCTNIKPKGVNSSKKRILYAPTFRSEKSTRLFPFENMDLSEFDRFLENANIEIIIRLHINDEKRYIKNEEYLSLKRIKFSGSNITPSINDILYSFDAVISDYSSITIDFLLLNKPIGYIPYDYDAYEKERGFSFEYHEHLSGPVIENQKDLEDFLLDSGTEHAPKRNKMRDKFHYHQDGNSSKRMYNFINTL